MDSKQQIIEEIEYIPEPLLNEIIDFIQFFLQKLDMGETNKLETARLSETSLARDLSTKEEDEAWQHHNCQKYDSYHL